MKDLEAEANALRDLARRKPTAARVKIVEAALSSNWEGIQSIALQTLAEWGDRRFVELIRPFLEGAFEKKNAWAIRRVAIEALTQLVGPEDEMWLTEFVRTRTGPLDQYELRPLITRLSELKR